MKRILIFGNSGSGKSTLANDYRASHGIAHLDLDSLAWENVTPPKRKPLSTSEADIQLFLDTNEEWVIEGCYSDLLAVAAKSANEAIFLNPGVEQCISNCRNRPWEPHKYASEQEQNNNLAMLIEWVKQYHERNDEFSLTSHQGLFDEFQGKKTEHRSNIDITK